MVKVSFGMTAAIGLFAVACGVPLADDDAVYKVVVNGKTVFYGTQSSDGFTACNGLKVDVPAGAKLVRAGGACPDDSAFVPHAGHIPAARPKSASTPKPKPT